MKKILLLVLLLSLWLSSYSQYPMFNIRDTINFETNTLPYQIVPNMENAWEIGVPQKTDFNSAFSPPNALVTSLQNPYPPVNISGFEFHMPTAYYIDPDFPYMSTFLSFRHKFDTDTLQDWCRVEISYDYGNNWHMMNDTLIIDSVTNFPYICQWYTPLSSIFGNESRVSGKSNGWVQSVYIWQWMVVVKSTATLIPNLADSLFIRFLFTSDAIQNNKEGWMIDDIFTGWADLGGGTILNPDEAWTLSPNPTHDLITISNTMNYKADNILISDLTGNVVYKMKTKNQKHIEIPLGHLPPSIYFCRIQSGNSTFKTFKICKL
ncbi:MAG: T9SS type A sorting domain-containing protein [Bacteroidetes bacterium]|nr:T9SS type A sorting domain-containing protein [Bacteroidota bacterium]